MRPPGRPGGAEDGGWAAVRSRRLWSLFGSSLALLALGWVGYRGYVTYHLNRALARALAQGGEDYPGQPRGPMPTPAEMARVTSLLDRGADVDVQNRGIFAAPDRSLE